MASFHESNLKLQPYDPAKLIELAEHADRLGIQFKVAGIPFGADYDRKLWDDFYGQSGTEDKASPVSVGSANKSGVVEGGSGPTLAATLGSQAQAPKVLQTLDSGYASLDVKWGREQLEKLLKESGPKRVIIAGDLTHQVSHDDGTSAEFGIDVKSAVIIE